MFQKVARGTHSGLGVSPRGPELKSQRGGPHAEQIAHILVDQSQTSAQHQHTQTHTHIKQQCKVTSNLEDTHSLFLNSHFQ